MGCGAEIKLPSGSSVSYPSQGAVNTIQLADSSGAFKTSLWEISSMGALQPLTTLNLNIGGSTRKPRDVHSRRNLVSVGRSSNDGYAFQGANNSNITNAIGTGGGMTVIESNVRKLKVCGATAAGFVLMGTMSDISEAVSSATLELRSTTKGFLPNRGTLAQRDAIILPADMLVFAVIDGAAAQRGIYRYDAMLVSWIKIG